MLITGKFYRDENYINVCTGNRLYTIPRNDPNNWGSRAVGEWASGFVFRQEDYDRELEKCTGEGTFDLD